MHSRLTHRRTFIRSGAAVAITGVSGCFGSDDDLADDTADEGESEEVIFIDPGGADDNVGTEDSPIRTVQEGLDRAGAGETIRLAPGEYHNESAPSSPFRTVRSGEPDEPITITGPVDAIVRPGIHIDHSHIRVTGTTIEGLVNPAAPEDPDSYGPYPLNTMPPADSDDYLEDIVLAPHGIGYSAHALIRVHRTKDIEIGPLKVTGLAGASWILPQEPDRHAGEIVYLGAPATLVFDSVGPVIEDYPWPGEVDQTRRVHIHHIDNSEAHPHSQLVDAKDGTRDVLVEYCTDAGGSQNTEPWPVDTVGFRSYDATLRWCDLRNGEGNAIKISGAPRVIEELDEPPAPPERFGTGHAIYGNYIAGFDHQDIVFAGAEPSEQDIICGNAVSGLHLPAMSQACPNDVPRSDGIGHDGKPLPEAEVPRIVQLSFIFNRVPREDEINPAAANMRYVAFMCHQLTLLDAQSTILLDIDVGVNEADVVFGEGVHGAVSYDEGTSRFFGSSDRITELYFEAKQVAEAKILRIRGWPVDDEISAALYFEDKYVDSVVFKEGMRTYELNLGD